jgi:hypothetical protein
MTDERELMIGVGRSDITPPVGTELHGGPRRVSDSVRDPLYATAIALDDGARRTALVVCDLLHFPDDFLRAAIADIEAATDLAAEDILLSATHNHSGPTLDEPYGTALRGKLCECVEEARAESYDMTRRAGRKIAGEALKVFEATDTRPRRHHRARVDDRHMDWVFADVDTPSVTNLGVSSRRFTASPFEERPDQAARTGEVRVMVVNDIALVGIPGDTYAEIGMEIRQRSRSRHTLVLGHTNGFLSYIPVPGAYDEGGYSVAAAKSANTGPGTARIVVETALDLIEDLMRGDA